MKIIALIDGWFKEFNVSGEVMNSRKVRIRINKPLSLMIPSANIVANEIETTIVLYHNGNYVGHKPIFEV